MITMDYFQGLPLEYESFLIQKYESFLTTCRYIEIYYPTHQISYMLVRENGNLIDLLLFGVSGDTAICFNSFVKFNPDIISVCSKKLFEECPMIKKMNVGASYSTFEKSSIKALLICQANEYIIHLPASYDVYISQLGHSTRKSVRNHKSKLLRDFPEVKFSTKYGNEIDESLIAKIIQLNIARMKCKGIIPSKDENEAQKMYRYCKHYGVVTIIEINDEIVAGDIAFILNNRMFTEVIAHDNNFSTYNLGEICMFHMIETAISKGIQTLYMSWGDNEYKKRLLAKPTALYSYTLFRNYSFGYFQQALKSVVMLNVTKFRLSKYSLPIREAIKTYRKRKWIIQAE